jgi:GNAT superfamily N-acetyltransferase
VTARPAIRPVTDVDHPALLAAFAEVVAEGTGYPQDPDEPVTWDDFHAYWLATATAAFVLVDDGDLAGGYTIKPNGVGRAAHVANAGYFVRPGFRGRGHGERLVEHSLDEARRRGFDAMQFNFVFASNPARHLYERLGFRVVGAVPRVIGDESVLVYWREL